MKLVCFVPSEDLPRFSQEYAGEAVEFCTDIEEISFSEQRHSIFVLAHDDPKAIIRLVHVLRQNTCTSLQPLYTLQSFGKPLDLLTDGVVASVPAARIEAEPILNRLAELDDSVFCADASDYLRILALLYSRPDRQLAPHQVWLDEYAYAYTLLEAMLGSAHLVAARLATLCEWNYLQRRGLVDRTSHCPVCSSLQLNLIDHCPQCRGTDIEESFFVKCLLCGHTGQEATSPSAGGDSLQCSQCHALLQQIKTDYDWVQGPFVCRSCGSTFAQPEPRAHCLRCGNQAPVSRLLVRQIYSYELTAAGIAALKTGVVHDPADAFTTNNLVTPHFFINMVNWLLDFCGRNSCETFTLIGIKLGFTGQVEADSSQAGMELMDTFVYRISERIRSVDILSRFQQDLLWLLLPKTGNPNHQVVLNRLNGIQKAHRGFGNEELEVLTVTFHAPDDIVPGETSPLLLRRLETCFAEPAGLGE